MSDGAAGSRTGVTHGDDPGEIFPVRSAADRLYAFVADEEDARVCRDIPEEACDEQPLAFSLQLAAQTLTKFGDLLVSPRITLTWALSSLGSPSLLIGLLVPIRESFSLLPQLVVAAAVRRSPLRKPSWVVGALLQGACVLGMLMAMLVLEGMALGLVVIGLLALFSLCRGVCSVAAKDVLGKTVSRTRRGRLTGLATSVSGLAILIFASGLLLSGAAGTQAASPTFFAWLLAAGAALWFLASGVFARVPEQPGSTGGGANAIVEAWRSLRLLLSDRPFRTFVITRGVLVATAFAVPYFVLLVQRQLGSGATGLATLLLADGAACLLSGYFWGRWADHSSERVMGAAALLSTAGLALALAADCLDVPIGLPVFGGILLVLTVSHQGVRIARKTYLVDLATQETRAAYTAVSNTVIGVVLLLGALLGAVDSYLGIRATLWLLLVAGLAGAALAWRLPSVD